MTPAQILRAAREVYERSPSHAPRGEQPMRGEECVLSACTRASLDGGSYPGGQAFLRALRLMGKQAAPRHIIDFNAEESTEAVLAAFDAAIQEAQA